MRGARNIRIGLSLIIWIMSIAVRLFLCGAMPFRVFSYEKEKADKFQEMGKNQEFGY